MRANARSDDIVRTLNTRSASSYNARRTCFTSPSHKLNSHAMPPFADVYVLAKSRSEAAVVEFLAHFAPQREQSAGEYWVPQHADSPRHLFRAASEVITYCCRHPTETQSIYWRRFGDGELAHVMVFFTSDAQLIFGLSVGENAADRFHAELRKYAHSDIGYIASRVRHRRRQPSFASSRTNPPPNDAHQCTAVA